MAPNPLEGVGNGPKFGNNWIASTVQKRLGTSLITRSPSAELDEYLKTDPEPDCPDVVGWWGVSSLLC